jgi:hypothetical protein
MSALTPWNIFTFAADLYISSNTYYRYTDTYRMVDVYQTYRTVPYFDTDAGRVIGQPIDFDVYQYTKPIELLNSGSRPEIFFSESDPAYFPKSPEPIGSDVCLPGEC